MAELSRRVPLIALARRRPARLVAPLVGVVLLATPVVVAVLVRNPGQRAGTEPPQPVPASRPFPTPPAGAVVFSRQLGSDALALAVVSQSRKLVLQASVVGQDFDGVRGLAVSFTAQGVSTRAKPCGPGCYRGVLETRNRPRAVVVTVRGASAPARWSVPLPARWPPADAGALVARAERAWRSLHSLSFREVLASDTRHRVTSTWRIQAPDRLAYVIKGGWAAVVIGGRRWDRAPGGRWIASPQSPITQPVPTWGSVADAHVIGTANVDGKPAWRISFFDPRLRAWFTVALDRRTLRTLDIHMVTSSHFMHDVYSSFDTTPAIRQPAA